MAGNRKSRPDGDRHPGGRPCVHHRQATVRRAGGTRRGPAPGDPRPVPRRPDLLGDSSVSGRPSADDDAPRTTTGAVPGQRRLLPEGTRPTDPRGKENAGRTGKPPTPPTPSSPRSQGRVMQRAPEAATSRQYPRTPTARPRNNSTGHSTRRPVPEIRHQADTTRPAPKAVSRDPALKAVPQAPAPRAIQRNPAPKAVPRNPATRAIPRNSATEAAPDVLAGHPPTSTRRGPAGAGSNLRTHTHPRSGAGHLQPSATGRIHVLAEVPSNLHPTRTAGRWPRAAVHPNPPRDQRPAHTRPTHRPTWRHPPTHLAPPVGLTGPTVAQPGRQPSYSTHQPYRQPATPQARPRRQLTGTRRPDRPADHPPPH